MLDPAAVLAPAGTNRRQERARLGAEKALESIAEAFSIAENYSDGVGKMIVQP